MDFQDHCLRLYLDPELYMAHIKLQGDRGLGRSYAGLIAFTEGMYHLGFISKEVYEEHVRKYSEKLVAESKPLTPEQVQERQTLEQKNRFFKEALAQWAIHKDPAWREKILKQAEQWKDKLESARLIADLRDKAVVQ
jgi:hypothetical protein